MKTWYQIKLQLFSQQLQSHREKLGLNLVYMFQQCQKSENNKDNRDMIHIQSDVTGLKSFYDMYRFFVSSSTTANFKYLVRSAIQYSYISPFQVAYS